MNTLTLKEELKAYSDASATRIPEAAQRIMKQAIEDLESSSILDSALKTGDYFPDFKLSNAKGENIHLRNLLNKGKVVLTFYRGGWCPYCNITLKAFQRALPEIKSKGATLVAITPETPDNTLTTAEKNELEFEVLTSKNNVLAKSLGLVYQLPESLVDLYKKFGIDLTLSQGNDNNELPIAATYIIDQDEKITYHFLEEDYKLRADIVDIFEAL